jgi:hypothetical protein
MLKHRLVKKHTIVDLANAKKGFGHNLPRLWEEFKADVADASLARFDKMIVELQRFEDIRYPDELAMTGGGLSLVVKRKDEPVVDMPSNPSLPQFCLALDEMDALMLALCDACPFNPRSLSMYFRGDSGKHLLRDNDRFQASLAR